ATGHVSGSMSLGGLIGQLSLGAVQQSCALGSVSGGYNLGGLIATAYQGTVNQCYAAGIVEDEFDSGGLIGTATESSVSGSFWDSERSGLAVSAGGTPETTEHMQQQATFATEGWTFWNEDDGIWDISEGETYPWLWDMDHGLIAEFTATPLSGVLPLTVDFTDLSLFCSSPIGSWNWYFGDGLSSDEANPSHTYTTSGVYTVTLTVESEDFWEHAFVKKVGYITVDALPTADFSYDSSVGEVPFTVHFTDTSDPGTRTITSWAWDFGDGDTSTDPNPDHEYTDEGRYTVSLTVTTELGSDTETKEDCIWATGIQIWNISNLGNIGNDPGYPLDGSYTMMDDIDASAKGVFAPIGSSATPFVGTFDGQGYTISGLTINQPSDNYIGLFSYLGDGAYIHDLRMEGGSITGNYYVGALAGGSTNVSITRCFAHTTVSGGITVGGLIGINSGLSVQECSANCTVSAVSARGGGLFGQTTDSTVADSYAEGDVDAGLGVGKVEIGHAGGFVGSASSTSFANCWASGSVSAPVYAGGFAGSMGTGSTADRCFAGGTVSGNDNVGGFAGYIQQPSQVLTLSKCLALGNVQQLTSKDDKTITGQQGGLAGYSQNALMEDCYAQGAVQGSYYVAGLVGYASRGSFTRCYSTGNITGTLYLGGLVAAIDSCSATDCFWDTESSGQTTSALGTGKTTAEMMTQDTYTNWDFETVWAIDEGFSYPWLQEDGP
nr:PKD domain-containing protein [Candidatus Hydrogenedentota bacterium]